MNEGMYANKSQHVGAHCCTHIMRCMIIRYSGIITGYKQDADANLGQGEPWLTQRTMLTLSALLFADDLVLHRQCVCVCACLQYDIDWMHECSNA